MMGALTVLILASLVVPIIMLVLALVFDAFLATWVAYEFWHDEWRPNMSRSLKHGWDVAWHWVPHPHIR